MGQQNTTRKNMIYIQYVFTICKTLVSDQYIVSTETQSWVKFR